MTYKGIIANMVNFAARNKIEKLCKEADIPFTFTEANNTELTLCKDAVNFSVDVIVHKGLLNTVPLQVCGYCDEYGNIHPCVVWWYGTKIIWTSVQSRREELGITEFKI